MTAALSKLELEAFELAKGLEHAPEMRLRSGHTEKIWTYVGYRAGAALSSIDWRQSAKGTEILVREHEPLIQRDAYFWASFAQATEDRDYVLTLMLALGYLLARKERNVACACGDHKKTQSTQHIRGLFEDSLTLPLSTRRPHIRHGFLIMAENLHHADAEFMQTVTTYAEMGHKGLILHLGGQPLPSQALFRRVCKRIAWPIVEINRNERLDRCLIHLFEKSMDATR